MGTIQNSRNNNQQFSDVDKMNGMESKRNKIMMSSIQQQDKSYNSAIKKKVFDQGEGDKKKPMNKAEIYQAVRKARLRSNYMNRDLSLQSLTNRQNKEKFHPYFQEISRKQNNMILQEESASPKQSRSVKNSVNVEKPGKEVLYAHVKKRIKPKAAAVVVPKINQKQYLSKYLEFNNIVQKWR